MRAVLFLLTITSLFGFNVRAATIARWTFESPNIPPSTTGTTISGLAPNIGSGTASGFHADSTTLFSTAIGNGSANSLSANRWSSGDYWQFQVGTLNFIDVQVSFAQRSDNIGPTNFTFAYSLDGSTFTTIGPNFFQVRADNSGGAWNFSTGNPNTIMTFDLSATNVLENMPNVYFRLSALFTAPNSGTSRVDDFSITATAVPEPAGLALIGVTALLFCRRHPGGVV